MTLTIPQRNSLVQEYLWCIDSVIKQNYSLLKAAHLDRDDVYPVSYTHLTLPTIVGV